MASPLAVRFVFPDGHVVGLAHLTSITVECLTNARLFHGGTALFDRGGLKLEASCTVVDQPLVELSSDLVPPVEGRRVVHHDLAVFGVQVSAARAVTPCERGTKRLVRSGNALLCRLLFRKLSVEVASLDHPSAVLLPASGHESA